MAQQDAARGEHRLAERRLPASSIGADRDLTDDDLHHPVEEVVLAAHVRVERHRLDPELLAEPAHADRADSVAVGELHGRRQDALPGQLHALLRACLLHRSELHA